MHVKGSRPDPHEKHQPLLPFLRGEMMLGLGIDQACRDGEGMAPGVERSADETISSGIFAKAGDLPPYLSDAL